MSCNDRKHPPIARKDLGFEVPDALLSGNRRKAPQYQAGAPASLVGIDDHERDLCAVVRCITVVAPASDQPLSILVQSAPRIQSCRAHVMSFLPAPYPPACQRQ